MKEFSANYFYYPPKNPQFFFPKKEFKEFQEYYTPFSTKAKLFWFLYKNCVLVRSFFKTSEKEIPLPIAEIKKISKLKNAVYFYNLGTEGIEQSATIIAKNKEAQCFLKFAQKNRAKELVVNETKVLLKLEKHPEFNSAKVFGSDSNKSHAYLLTEVIFGKKAKFITLNESVYQLLISLTKKDKRSLDFEKVFTHGDFCPWNMLVHNTKGLILIDWEMAGYQPLGYDLFTFIFQTNFLLYPAKSIATIVSENQLYIENYFKEFKIENWQAFLVKFATIKKAEEMKKPAAFLHQKYKELIRFNE